MQKQPSMFFMNNEEFKNELNITKKKKKRYSHPFQKNVDIQMLGFYVSPLLQTALPIASESVHI